MNLGIPKPKIKIQGTITRKSGEVVPFTLTSVDTPTLSDRIRARKAQNRNSK